MGGQFQVESALGAGTTFRFAIPLEAAGGAAEAGEAGEGAGRALAGRACLLLVHNGSMAAILQEQLAAWGMRATHAPTVAAAQQLLTEQVQHADLEAWSSQDRSGNQQRLHCRVFRRNSRGS